ncbi:Arf guanine-nucleotide exchange factor gnom [Thalictrum thalictroides]|uniref:Arf guanine-nucleotide exchange factor gnom n=1 Tax=Thalictrum thalictroides TaxID=46969 RepID=A0A7J6VA39_THATH|nr:Arf guanine-nucleotide exchange factor gnom [Thalictrum thalictroides]
MVNNKRKSCGGYAASSSSSKKKNKKNSSPPPFSFAVIRKAIQLELKLSSNSPPTVIFFRNGDQQQIDAVKTRCREGVFCEAIKGELIVLESYNQAVSILIQKKSNKNRPHPLIGPGIQANVGDELEEEPRSQPPEEHLQLELARALVWAAGKAQKGNTSPEDEDPAVFCMELLITITLNNRDRIPLLWQTDIYSIVESTLMPCALVEKAVFGLLRICQRLLPYKEDLADELLRSLRLVLKLDAHVADAYCENIAHELTCLVKANATHLRSLMGWRTITSLLSITARHPDTSEAGFEALMFIMSDGVHLPPANYVLCVDAARQFAESRVGEADRPLCSVDLMAGSIACLLQWSGENKEAVGKEGATKVSQDMQEMWLRLVQGLDKYIWTREKRVGTMLLLLQRCLMGVDGLPLSF